MGGHVDYNEGFVLPVAIDLECVVAARPTTDGLIAARSLDFEGPEATAQLRADGRAEPNAPPWARLLAGVARALAEAGRPSVGMEATIASSVPIGSGLSSSAAFEVACALALCRVADFEIDRKALALACRGAEEAATGVPCGVMDQMASLFGVEGHALLIDCRSLEVTPIPIRQDVEIVAIHSGLPRTLAGSAFSDRRRECERLARLLGVRALRDATARQVADNPLGRHVVSEIARVLKAAEALETGDLDTLGGLFAGSQASLRDDYGVSTPELDLLVRLLVEKGAVGARLTGAGFGGCVVSVVETVSADNVIARVLRDYRAKTSLGAVAFRCVASPAAGEVRPRHHDL